MVQDAENYAQADKQRREEAEQLNTADAVCYEAEKTLSDFAEKLTEDLKSRIELALRDTKAAVLKKNAALATEQSDKLKKILKEAGATLYSQTGSAQKGKPYTETRWQDPSTSSNPSGQAKVVDAEFHDVH
jgi:molecular chaperone DnaK